jgi:hypothetical protein
MAPRKKVLLDNALPVEKPVTKRKSKKPIQVVAVVTPEGIEGNFNPEPRKPLIAHLEVHSNEIIFPDQQLRYDPQPPNQPEPYDPMADDNFAMTEGVIEEERKDSIQKPEEVTLK